MGTSQPSGTPSTGSDNTPRRTPAFSMRNTEREDMTLAAARIHMEARGFLDKNGYVDANTIGVIIRQILLDTKKDNKINQDLRKTLTATAVVAENINTEHIIANATEAIQEVTVEGERRLKAVRSAIEMKLEEQAEAVGKEIHTEIVEFREWFDEKCKELVFRPQVTTNPPTETDTTNATTTSANTKETSYAAAVARQLTRPLHEIAIQKANTQAKQVLITKNASTESNPLEELNEMEILRKANLAIETMMINTPPPNDFKIVAARKLKRGAVLLTTNSLDAAKWFCGHETLELFNTNFSATTTAQANAFHVLLENVPVVFDIDNEANLRHLEQTNNLPTHAIRAIKWMKPTHLRRPGQRTAHIQMGLNTREEANTLIESGAQLEGTMVRVRKMTHLSHKCNKCAEYGTHQAKDCKAIIDVCTQCAGGHKTNECTVTDPNLFRCPNCKLLGHKAADPNCQAYNKQLEDLAR